LLFTRPDGTRVKDVAPFRRIMPFIMKSRTESAVYFEQHLDLTKTIPFIEAWNGAKPDRKISVFHVFLWAVVRALAERPRLNRFVTGSHLWQRDGIWISFSAKKELTDGAPVVVLKRRFEPTLTFSECVDLIYRDVQEGRSDRPTHVDRELALVLALPGPLLGLGVALLRWLDRWNLLPGSFIHSDPMYTSMFIANLGSVRLDSAYHHLYEWGNCPLFAALGRTKDVVTPDGHKRMCSVKYTFDERIEDGLYCAKGLERVKELVEDPGAPHS
jgi:hypothetical protein